MGGIPSKALLGAVLTLVFVGALGGAWFKGRAAGMAACEARHQAAERDALRWVMEAERRSAEIVADIDRRLSERLAQIRIEHTTINRTIEHEIREVPVYSECRLSQRVFDALQGLRAATHPATDGGADGTVHAP